MICRAMLNCITTAAEPQGIQKLLGAKQDQQGNFELISLPEINWVHKSFTWRILFISSAVVHHQVHMG